MEALLLLAAIVVMAVAGCGAGGGDATIEELPSSPVGKVEAGNFDGVHSGEVALWLRIARYGKRQESFKLHISGNFMKAGEEALPQVDLAIESNGDLAGRHVEFLSGPLLRSDKWIVNFAGKVYEPDKATFREVKSKLEEAQREEGGEGNAMACVEAAEGLDVASFVQDVTFKGKGELLDGSKVETVGAQVDLPAVVAELVRLTEESPGCRAQLEAIGLPPAAALRGLEKELEGSLKSTRLTLSLDKHGLVRSFTVIAKDGLPGNEELEVELLMRLNGVNEVTELPITHGYTPYAALLKEFGLSNEDVRQAGAGEIYLGVLEALADRLFGRQGA